MVYFLVSVAAKATSIACDTAVITLIWIKTFGIQRASLRLNMHTPLVTLLVRDGRETLSLIILFSSFGLRSFYQEQHTSRM